MRDRLPSPDMFESEQDTAIDNHLTDSKNMNMSIYKPMTVELEERYVIKMLKLGNFTYEVLNLLHQKANVIHLQIYTYVTRGVY